jgi:hypothetical protein
MQKMWPLAVTDLFPETVIEDAKAWISAAKKSEIADDICRYHASRIWDPSAPYVAWNCLNPSKASGLINDPSIIRMMEFSAAWGFGGLHLLNIYPFRSPHPNAMQAWLAEGRTTNRAQFAWQVSTNLVYVDRYNRAAGRVIAAWGNNAAESDIAGYLRILRGAGVEQLLCLGHNENGSPRHPLSRGKNRVPKNFAPIPWQGFIVNAVPTKETNPEPATEQPTEQRNQAY